MGLAFENAVVETVVLLYGKIPNSVTRIKNDFEEKFEINIKRIIDLTEDKKFLIKLNEDSYKIIEQMHHHPKLMLFAKVWRGLTTGDDKKFISDKKLANKYKPLITGSDISRYGLLTPRKYVLYLPNKLDRSRDERIFLLKEKLISKFVGNRLTFTYDNNKYYILNSCCLTEVVNPSISIKYLLALLNSTLLNFYFTVVFSDNRETFPIMKSGNIENLPIVIADQNTQNIIHILVDIILFLQSVNEKAISLYFERLVDALVYELYFNAELKDNAIAFKTNLGNPSNIEELSSEKRLSWIKNYYKELINPHHPISSSMHKLLNIKVIAIIEGRN